MKNNNICKLTTLPIHSCNVKECIFKNVCNIINIEPIND